MPQFSKKSLSQFIRTGCLRQLALDLFPDNQTYGPERQARGMPHPQSPRPGLRQVQAAGDEWAEEKLHDLTQTFGQAAVRGDPRITPTNHTRYEPVQLDQYIRASVPIQFIVEAEFPIGASFLAALGITGHSATYGLRYSDLRPDIIAVLAPGTFTRFITPIGTVHPLPAADTRRQLRVIDIKLTAQASPGYFAEIALYSMTLAAWLTDQGLDGAFVVVPDGAVWPGAYEASHLLQYANQSRQQGLTPSTDDLWNAMQQDLEPVPFEVFALRVRRFLQFDVVQALSSPWQSLEWHVDSRCSFCEYLGEDRPATQIARDANAAPHADHCLPTATRSDHLSRVAFVSQGARLSLTQAGVTHVANLATRPATDVAFNTHQTLRATRSVVAGRAVSLQSGQVFIPPQSGSSAGMPRWADLRVYLSADFDIGSAITVAFGLKAFWIEPRGLNSPLTAPRQTQLWQSTAYVVDERNLTTERRELMAFLARIHEILDWCRQRDQQTAALPAIAAMTPRQRQTYRTSVQFYLWDTLQFDHLTRVIGRHLPFILPNTTVNYLAWLFPPDEILPNPDLATRRSPITIVRDVIRGLLAAPVPHYYGLLEIARVYHDPRTATYIAQQRLADPDFIHFNPHPLFGTSLSDQIPSERAHEIWSRVTAPRHWSDQLNTYRRTVGVRLDALSSVTERLETDLRPQLNQAAPQIDFGPPPREARLSDDGQLWYAFARLNVVLAELDVHQSRAMPVHERAARFHSARLPLRLTGQAEAGALAALGGTARIGRRVYEMAADSRDVKAKVGDFAFALAPEAQDGFLDDSIARLVRGTPLEQVYNDPSYWNTLVERGTQVTIAALDRNLGLIAVDLPPNAQLRNFINDLQTAGIADFEQNVILDRVHGDFFLKKLLAALRAVGNPPAARTSRFSALTQAATTAPTAGRRPRGANQTAHTPAADFIWNAGQQGVVPVARNLPPIRAQLTASGLDLNPTQWQAWEDALSYRARLVWGPPGTGKSRTVRTIIVGAILEAQSVGRPLRVLLTASTYNAIDNVLVDVSNDLDRLLPRQCATYRIRSRYQLAPAPGAFGASFDTEVNHSNPSQNLVNLQNALDNGTSLVVIGGTPEQVFNLLPRNRQDVTMQEWFDLLVIDEASQMDVAHMILPLCGLSSSGAVILAGDPLQLPPIQPAEAPAGLEHMVGSAYQFYRRVHQVPESPLGINYRSNETIVAFARMSGYQQTLQSFSPQLRIDLLAPLPVTQPANWPPFLHWCPEWSAMLDPDQPAVCFVYDDGRSSQRNEFEAEAVAAMLWLLHGRMSDQLRDENDAGTGAMRPPSTTAYSPQDFWQKAVGVVTPHRAQQALIVSRLQQVFNAAGPMADAIRDAVDTVERFQGQQRDVIVASFALGDMDQIGEEEEFLMSLNRFNVMASRARAKLIVLVSRQVVDHLASEVETLHQSRLLKVFVENFCNQGRAATLGYLAGTAQAVPGELRWHA
jgi:DNA replication ATP-dependent helicase Dna2